MVPNSSGLALVSGMCQHSRTPGQRITHIGYKFHHVRDSGVRCHTGFSSRGVQKCHADALTRYTLEVCGVILDRDDEPALTPGLASAVQTDRVPMEGARVAGDRSMCFPAQVRRTYGAGEALRT